MWMYVGTYTGTTSRGIYGVELNETTGQFSEPKLMIETPNPSFLALSADGQVLLAAADPGVVDGKKHSAAVTFRVDQQTRELKLISQQPTGAGGNCHVALSPNGAYATSVDYGSAIVNLLPVGADGTLEPATTQVQHHGHGPNKDRQEKAHAHCASFDPTGQFVLCCDLGTDEIYVYRITHDSKSMVEHSVTNAPPGSGPRHIDFSKDQRFVYVVNELDNTVDTFRWDAKAGTLTYEARVPTLPADFTKYSKASEVCVHPSGAFVYAANRGHDSIAVFHVDRDTGHLSVVGHTPCGGQNPRHFGVDPSGKFLICGHEDTGTLAAFKIDPQTGELTATGGVAKIAKAVCVVFA